MRIFLTGFMGAGKTTVGRELASRLGCPFVDLDDEIEREAGADVREIFAREGEAGFRERERGVFARVAARDPVVVAAGGGTFTRPENLELARAGGLVVWLNPEFATIVGRLGGLEKDRRPLFRDETSAFDLYRARLASYRTADLRIDVRPEETPAEVTERVRAALRERACAT